METSITKKRTLENLIIVKDLFTANRLAELYQLGDLPEWEMKNEGHIPPSKEALEIAKRYTREIIETYPQDIEYCLMIDGDVCIYYPTVTIICRTNQEVSLRVLIDGDYVFDEDYSKDDNAYIVDKLKKAMLSTPAK